MINIRMEHLGSKSVWWTKFSGAEEDKFIINRVIENIWSISLWCMINTIIKLCPIYRGTEAEQHHTETMDELHNNDVRAISANQPSNSDTVDEKNRCRVSWKWSGTITNIYKSSGREKESHTNGQYKEIFQPRKGL